MANDTFAVSGPVEIESASKQSIAFKLMKLIADQENAPETKKQTRQYWLTLYRHCHKATNGSSLESILREE